MPHVRLKPFTVDELVDELRTRPEYISELAECQRQRDALSEALRNCIPTLEDVAQNQKNIVDFGIIAPGFIQMATHTRDLIEKTMVYIQNALAKLDE